MEITKDNDGYYLLDISLKEGDDLADEIIAQTGKLDMHTALLDLSSLLRKAKFEAKDDFRSPPAGSDPAPSV